MTAAIGGFVYALVVTLVLPARVLWTGWFLCSAPDHLAYQETPYRSGSRVGYSVSFSCVAPGGAPRSASILPIIASQFLLGALAAYVVAIAVVLLVRPLLGGGGPAVPTDLRQYLEMTRGPGGGGLVLLEEYLRGSVTYRRYRAPGRAAWLEKQGVSRGAVAITDAGSLLIWTAREQMDAPRPSVSDRVRITQDRDRVCFTYDAGYNNPARRGTVEVRLRMQTTAESVVSLLKG
jgi:hypothetical protein